MIVASFVRSLRTHDRLPPDAASTRFEMNNCDCAACQRKPTPLIARPVARSHRQILLRPNVIAGPIVKRLFRIIIVSIFPSAANGFGMRPYLERLFPSGAPSLPFKLSGAGPRVDGSPENPKFRLAKNAAASRKQQEKQILEESTAGDSEFFITGFPPISQNLLPSIPIEYGFGWRVFVGRFLHCEKCRTNVSHFPCAFKNHSTTSAPRESRHVSNFCSDHADSA